MHKYVDLIGTTVLTLSRCELLSAVIFLSAKVDENPKTLRSVIVVIRKLLCLTIDEISAEEEKCRLLKEDVIKREQIILRAIRFDSNVDLPHKYLLNFSRFVEANFIHSTLCKKYL